MRAILVAAVVALAVSILFTPYLIRVFSRQGFGQEIREDGPQHHQKKRGTPTMGGTAILIAMWVGLPGQPSASGGSRGGGGPTASALLLLCLTTGMGLVGFLDDFIKIRKQRNLGLNKRMKFLGQTFVAVTFGIGALFFNNSDNLTPASTALSYTRDLTFLSFGAIGFVILAWLLVTAWSNAVNFTDGLDGLAAGIVGDGARHLRRDRILPVPQRLLVNAHRGAPPPVATTSATRSTSPWSPLPRSAAASASSGGTPTRRGS